MFKNDFSLRLDVLLTSIGRARRRATFFEGGVGLGRKGLSL